MKVSVCAEQEGGETGHVAVTLHASMKASASRIKITDGGFVTDPAATFTRLCRSAQPACTSFEFVHTEPDHSTIRVTALCLTSPSIQRISLFRSRDAYRYRVSRYEGRSGEDCYRNIIEELDLPDINLRAPLKLEPLEVAKPWGTEIWHTAIEQRGVCTVQGVPISWLLELCPEHLSGSGGDPTPILLKVLVPLPDAVYGDLYFELHERKRETYIVTRIDRKAWPDGVGRIRYGFSIRKIADYDDFRAFKKAYLHSVRSYQQTRRRIDEHYDVFRAEAGLDENFIPPAEMIHAWNARIEPALLAAEAEQRAAMNEFSAEYPLRTGDVIHIPPGVPHSLQHGVRVIEFQTPCYERLILSFNRKVLTQKHWDTEEALSRIRSPGEPLRPAALPRNGVIADMQEFRVSSLSLDLNESTTLDREHYCLLIGVTGSVLLGDQAMEPEDSYYLPACASRVSLHNTGNTPAAVLVAEPVI